MLVTFEGQTNDLDLDILDPHISSLSPWRNRRNVYLIYNQSEKMRGDPRITRSPNKKRKKRKDEKKRKRRQRRKPRRMKDERNRQSIGENKLPTHHIGHTQTPRRKQSPPETRHPEGIQQCTTFSIPQQGSNDSRHRRTYQHS